MRQLLITLIALLCTTAQADTVKYFTCNFDNDMPEGTTLTDCDAQTLHFTMIQAGFEQGDAWRVLSRDGRTFAAAPGRFKKNAEGTTLKADKRMALPTVGILDHDAVMRWQAATLAESLEKGASYEVWVTEEGTTAEGLEGNPLATFCEDDLNNWHSHEISLAQFAGRCISIVFRCTSDNSEILGIDDIDIEGGTGRYHLTSATENVHYGTTPITLALNVKATSATPITAFTAICEVPDGMWRKTIRKEISNIMLTQNDKPMRVEFDEQMNVAPGDTLTYTFRIETPGNTIEQPGLKGTVHTLLFPTMRRTVAEEGTGMWCTYCPRGIAAMNAMRERYPDTFIGIAVHYDDALENTDNLKNYRQHLDFPSFPSARLNRRPATGELMHKSSNEVYTIGEGGIETLFLNEQQEPAPADISTTWHEIGDGNVEIGIRTTFAVSRKGADYRLTAVAVEDDVTGTGFYQQNYYSGSETPMGGFENLPSRIIPFTFQDVARCELLDFEGVTDAFPSEIEAGTTHTYTFQTPTPQHIDLKKMRIVAMLIDAHQNRVVNAAQSSCMTDNDYHLTLDGINTPMPDKTTTPIVLADGRRATHLVRGCVNIVGGHKVMVR